MKRIVALLACLLLLAGCSAPVSAGVSQEEYDAVVAERDALLTQIEELTASTEPSTSPNTENETTPVVVATDATPAPEEPETPIGTRTNPATLGQPVTIMLDTWRGSGEATVTIKEVIRGDRAWKIAEDENRFNDPPEDGELLLFEVEYRLESWDGEDALDVNTSMFDYFDSTFSEIDTDFYTVVIPDRLGAEIYEGASTSGWAYMVVRENENAPLARLEDAWFCLYGEEGEAAPAPDDDATGDARTVKGEDINLRSGPGTDYDVVAKVSEPSSVTIIAQDGDWYEVEVGGESGYLREDFITLD